jgi:peptide/nickel transport system substrate-binding protein
MDRIGRRQIVQGLVATTGAMTLRAPSAYAQQDRQTLRFVAEADLKILDPVFTTAYITRNHGYLVYDTLFGTDENLQIQPQMVGRTTVSPDRMRYTFTLRDDVRWHDGQPVLSEDCVESLKRWGKRDRFGQLLMASTEKIVPVDKKTFTLELGAPFWPVLDALGKTGGNVPFMMPARVAATPPTNRSRRSSAPDRSNSPETNGNRASRSYTCATPTISRATRRRADQRAERKYTWIK